MVHELLDKPQPPPPPPLPKIYIYIQKKRLNLNNRSLHALKGSIISISNCPQQCGVTFQMIQPLLARVHSYYLPWHHPMNPKNKKHKRP